MKDKCECCGGELNEFNYSIIWYKYKYKLCVYCSSSIYGVNNEGFGKHLHDLIGVLANNDIRLGGDDSYTNDNPR